MRACLIALILACGLPAAAQDDERAPDISEGFDMMSEGTRLLLRGLAGELAPILEDLSRMIDDLQAYHPPEVLPNGDIILRRKTPRDPEPDSPDPLEEGEVEL